MRVSVTDPALPFYNIFIDSTLVMDNGNVQSLHMRQCIRHDGRDEDDDYYYYYNICVLLHLNNTKNARILYDGITASG